MKNKSFTLIELLVVIVIIGILAGVVIVSVSSSIFKANFAKAQAFSNTVQNELLGDLISEWTFDNPSLPGEDTWGNNDGTVSGATHKTKADGVCVYGGCMSFDGSDYINIPNNGTLNLTNQLTVNVWVYPINFNRQVVIERTNSGATGGSYSLYSSGNSTTDAGRILVYFKKSNAWIQVISSNSQISLNKWSNLIMTYDGLNAKLYIDGSFEKSGQLAGPLDSEISTLGIGCSLYNNSNFFNGSIDDVRIYNSVLSSAQIKQQYVAGLDSLLASGNVSKEEYDQKLNALAYAK